MKTSSRFHRVVLCVFAAVFAAGGARADVYTWSGGSDKWTTLANWKVAGAPATKLPGADDDVILPAPSEAANSYTVKASEAIAVRSFLIGSDDAASDCTATFESQTTDFHQIAGDLIVKAGGILTHTALASSVTTLAAVNRKLNMSVSGAATIEADGKINVKGCGFAIYKGPGANWGFQTGSCHGGSAGYCNKHCYGSIRRPVDPGSHSGGGVVCLDVASTLTVDGEINADGDGEQTSSGSILLLASGVYGGGKVYSRKTAYGSGGRIAIIQRSETEMTFSGTVDCGNGSYYLENADDAKDRGELKVSKKSCLLHPEVTDAQEPFSKVTVESGGALEIESGVTLCCTDALTVKGTLTSVAGGGALVLSPRAGQPFAFDGVASVNELVCTNEDAAISFASGSKMSVLDNGVLRLLGAEGHHLSLLAEDPATWTLEIGQMVDAKVEYADVKNGNATVLVADLGGSNLGGNNANWTFPRIPQVGDIITWGGGVSADWGDAMNWLDQDGAHRLPVPTDRVELNAGSDHYPLLTSDKAIYDLVIATGASLTLQGGNLTMARDLVCAGTLTCSGSETVSAGGTVSFAGGTFVRGTSTLVLTGTGPAAQSVNFGGSDVYQLVVRSTAVSFAGGFSAYGFSCLPTGACALVFSAGDLYAASGVRLVPGAGAFTLDSSVPGTKWRFKVGPGAACDGVSVADCDASEGSAIHTVDFIDRDGNVNWTKGASTWLGGASTDWGESTNWQGGVPTENTDVVILSGTKQPKLSQPTCVRSLSIGGGADAVTLTLSAELAVRETAFVGNNATLVIDKPMSVTNDFTLGNGGTLTHSKNGETQLYTLDLFVGGDMTVEPQGKIDVEGRGFKAGNNGPGGGSGYQTGGVYAGGANSNSKKPYGSIRRPTDLGSGSSGDGGGAVHLHVDGVLALDGTINANGNGGSQGGGSGTGGSVWIVASALTGGGSISCTPKYYSSGGRISVVQRKANDLSAFTGAGGKMSWDNGTCYIENANDEADRGELKISGSSASGYACSLSTRMTDEDVPFGKVTIAAGRTLNIEKGVILRSTGDVLASGMLSSATDGGGLELLPSAGSTVTVQGVMAFHTFICTNKDATVCFTDGSKITVRDNGTVWLSGEKGHLTTLLAPTAWELSIGSSVDAVIQYVAASNSTASAAKVSDLGGRDLGGNVNWEFPRAPEPGDTITWTGNGTADWGVADNWTDEFGDHRLPLETDRIVIGADAAPYPVVTASKSAMSFTVVEGASFTLDGADLTVAEYLTCAGTLTCRGPETVTVGGAVSFVGGTFVRGTSTIVLAGTDVTAQSVNFAGRELYNLDVRAQLVSFAGGFSAYGFTCEQAGAVALVFSAGDLYAASGVRLVPGADASLALDSSVPGTKWRFKVGPGAVCDGVSVADCDASEGSAIHTVDFIDRDGNVNWTKGASTWLGGTSTAWNDPENWKGGVPTNTTDVVILSGANAPKLSAPTCIQSLSIGGGTDAITLTLSAELSVVETAFVGNNATVVIDKPMSVTNDFTLGNGGTLTHSKNASTQLYTLDLFVGGNMTVEPQGTVDVTDRGFATGKGTGGHTGFQTGASYGGLAHYTSVTYGSIRRPVDLGSGGNSGPGGGAVKLQVNGVLTLDGKIKANATGTDYGGGSGSGGSIWIVASALTGSGSMSCTPGANSSGGRISVVQRKANDLSAFTGAGGTMSWDNGTCYVENANDEPDRGELKISETALMGLACSLSTRMTDEDVPFGKVTIAAGRTLNIEKGVTLSTYAGVAGGGSITSAVDGGGLDVLASGDTVAEIAGDVSVFSFVCTNGASEVEFAAGKTVTVADNGTLWLEGLPGRKTRLRSSVPDTQWKIAAGKNLTGKVRYLDVRDSNATGEPIKAKGSIGKKANNLNWEFPSGMALIIR